MAEDLSTVSGEERIRRVSEYPELLRNFTALSNRASIIEGAFAFTFKELDSDDLEDVKKEIGQALDAEKFLFNVLQNRPKGISRDELVFRVTAIDAIMESAGVTVPGDAVVAFNEMKEKVSSLEKQLAEERSLKAARAATKEEKPSSVPVADAKAVAPEVKPAAPASK